jgi:dTMP kinase
MSAGPPADARCFITIEGIDWCGKTTQAVRLAKWLSGRGYAVVGTREPGGTAAGQAIRHLLLDNAYQGLSPQCELMLFLADRAQHVDEVVRPALEEGKVVVCERYADSTVAYQGYGRGIDLELLRRLNGLVTGDLAPDLTLLLDLDPEQAAQRRFQAGAPARVADRMEGEAGDFRRRVASGYLELARAEPHRFRVIDASGSVDEVAARVIETVSTSLPALEGGSP